MSTQPKDVKPRPMHGIVPTPYEIPPEHLAGSRPEKKEPLFISLMAGYLLIRGGFYLLLALVPWSDPESGVAQFLIARGPLVFGLLPQWLQPPSGMAGVSPGAYANALPFVFGFAGLVYVGSAWKLWSLDRFFTSMIRWGMMFVSLATVARLAIVLSARFIGTENAPLSDSMMLALFVTVVWNLVIFGCFAACPEPE